MLLVQMDFSWDLLLAPGANLLLTMELGLMVVAQQLELHWPITQIFHRTELFSPFLGMGLMVVLAQDTVLRVGVDMEALAAVLEPQGPQLFLRAAGALAVVGMAVKAVVPPLLVVVVKEVAGVVDRAAAALAKITVLARAVALPIMEGRADQAQAQDFLLEDMAQGIRGRGAKMELVA